MQSMLKDGHKMLSGLEEAVKKNIEACKQLSTMARTSMGPNGSLFMIYFARVSIVKIFVARAAFP